MGESTNLPVPTKVEEIGSYLVKDGKPTSAGQRMLSVLPFSDEVERKRFLNIGMEVSRNRALTKCTPVSVLIAMLDVAKVGLSLNSNLGEASILPFSGNAKMITGYKGYMKLARRGGEVTSIEVNLVHQNDQFPIELGQRTAMQRWASWDVIGSPNPGKLIGGFCRAIIMGAEQLHWVSIADFERAKASSASWRKDGEKSVWGTNYEAMCRKTIIRRAAALWPQTDAMGLAIAREEEAEGERPSMARPEIADSLGELGFDIPQQDEEVIDADFTQTQATPPAAAPQEDEGFKELRRAYNALKPDQKNKVLQAAKIANINEVKGDAGKTRQLEGFIMDLLAGK